jgi:hypothetical protein
MLDREIFSKWAVFVVGARLIGNCVYAVLGVWLAFELIAPEHSATAADVLSGPCKQDVMRYCKDVKPGSGRTLRCIKRNEERLSPECKAHRELKKMEIRQRMLACQPDAEKLCKDLRPGRGRIHKCLKRHEDELSPACLAEVERVK